jgi:isopenicillin-N epimerase
MPEFGRSFLAHWSFDPAITYLNHGTVGAPPRKVLEAQQALRDEIERQPSKFLLRELTEVGIGGPHAPERPRLRVAAAAVAEFLGAAAEDLAFVDNATTGANSVLRSLRLEAGEEILVTNHGYGGITNAARYAARERGATLRTLELPFPWAADEEIVARIAAALGPRTKLAIVDHIAADSALIFPVRRIVEACHAQGVPVLIDGAHAPGAITLDIPSLGADYYTGNLHKWCWSPRSSGVLWVDPSRQKDLHSAVISWGLDLGLSQEFDLPGTRDPTPHLAAPAAIELMRSWGVEAIQGWNHRLAFDSAIRLSQRWGTEFSTPESMVGPMVVIAVPAALGSTREEALALRDALLFEDGIEIPVTARDGRLWVRLAIQIYNDASDVDRLGAAIEKRARE